MALMRWLETLAVVWVTSEADLEGELETCVSAGADRGESIVG